MFRSRVLLLLPLLALSGALLAQETVTPPPPPETLTKEVKEEVLAAIEEVITKRAFVPGVELSKWPEFLAKQREAVDKAEKDTEFARAVNTALRDFGISHIRFLAPRTAQARTRTSAIGVGLNARAEKEGLVVTMIFPKSPAEEAGIKAGETIVEVEGKLPDSMAVLNGDEGTTVAVKVKDKEGMIRELKLPRKTYSVVREDTLTWPNEETAVLKIHSFSRGYSQKGIEKLMEEASKAKYLVLDLRSNGGGATNNLQHLLSMLLPPDTIIGTFISRSTSEAFAKANEGRIENDPLVLAKEAKNRYRTREGKVPYFKGKIAVLINRGSASASEICAAALKEHVSATIVGSRSAGAVLASVFRKLPQGYEVQYPVSDYVTNAGVRLEKNPVVPDEVVTEPAADGKDPVLEKAMEKLKGAGGG
ncbi:MAG: S41 family peptidase [Fimbriimonas sp.]